MISAPMVCGIKPESDSDDDDRYSRCSSTLSLQLSDCSKEFQCLGLVIWHQDGYGEVMVHEQFKGSCNVHYVYQPETSIKYSACSDPLGVGSIVNINCVAADSISNYRNGNNTFSTKGTTTSSFQTQHVVQYITKMEVRECSVIERLQIVIIAYCPSSAPATAIGRKQDYEEVYFHSFCQHHTKQATYNAAVNNQKSFHHPFPVLPPCTKEKLCERYLARLPFTLEFYCDSFQRINFLAISDEDYAEKRGDLYCCGPAVITKEISKFAFEARFISNKQAVFCPLSSFQSEILNSVRVARLVNVKANATFPNSIYHWYGIDVTTATSGTEDAQELRRLCSESKKQKIDFPGTGLRELVTSTDVSPTPEMNAPSEVKGESKEETKPQMKRWLRHSFFFMKTFNVCGEVFMKKFKDLQRMKHTRKNQSSIDSMDSSSKKEILLPWNASHIEYVESPVVEQAPVIAISRVRDLLPIQRTQTLQTVKRVDLLKGLHDNFQWLLMSTFAPLTATKEEMEGSAPVVARSDGFWYRRKAPRDAPVFIVAQLCTARDVFTDCTVDMYTTETTILYDDVA